MCERNMWMRTLLSYPLPMFVPIISSHDKSCVWQSQMNMVVLYCRTFIKGGAHMCFIHASDICAKCL